MAFQTMLPIRWPRAVRLRAKANSKEVNPKMKAPPRAKPTATSNPIHLSLELLKFRANPEKELSLMVSMAR